MLENFLKRIPASFVLFLFFLSIYLFTMSGVIQYGDEAEKYLVAQSIVERHDFSFRPTVMRNEVGVGGQSYSVYELGTSLLQVPFYLLGRFLLNFSRVPDPNWITILTVGLLNPLLTAFACVLFFQTALRLGYRSRTAVALTLTFGLATITFPYAKGYNREPILTVLLLILFYASLRFDQTHARRWLVASGIAAGALVFTKLIQAAVLPVFFAYLVAVIVQQRKANPNRVALRRELAQATAIFLAPIIISLAIQASYSYLRFGTIYGGLGGTRLNPLDVIASLLVIGNPVETGIRMLFSLDKSVFVYSPPIILFLFAWHRWFVARRKEALVALGLIVIAFLAAVPRPDGDTPAWWGPRYLVQVTPFFLFPVGMLLESGNAAMRRFWASALGILFAIGVVIQGISVFANSRDIVDITGIGVTLASQWDYLRHRALDSLYVYFSPTGFRVQFNPFGILLIIVAVALGAWILIRFRRDSDSPPSSPKYGRLATALILSIELLAFTFWVVGPYPRVLSAQADTKFYAANQFLAVGRTCQARSMYLLALRGGTTLQQQTLLRLDQLMPRAQGDPLDAEALMRNPELPDGATAGIDTATTISGDGSLKITAPEPNDAIVRGVSEPIAIQPNATYELSGWIKTENVYGSGNAVITVHEDDGAWGKPRGTDAMSAYETSGWRPFQKIITPLPTTRRVFIAGGLWKANGTVWIDGLRLAKISKANPPSTVAEPCQ